MNKVQCPFCKNKEIQVGFVGVNVAAINCIALNDYSKIAVDVSGKGIKKSVDILCTKCNNVFTVEKNCDTKTVDFEDRNSLMLNLNVKNESSNQTILIKNNEMVPPFHKWETSIPAGNSINYTKSPDFYMTFIQRVDPPVCIENFTNNALYELNVYRNNVGAFTEKKVLVPCNYQGDHQWRVLLNAQDGIRAVAFSVKSYLLKNEEITFQEYMSKDEVKDIDQKLKNITDRINK